MTFGGDSTSVPRFCSSPPDMYSSAAVPERSRSASSRASRAAARSTVACCTAVWASARRCSASCSADTASATPRCSASSRARARSTCAVTAATSLAAAAAASFASATSDSLGRVQLGDGSFPAAALGGRVGDEATADAPGRAPEQARATSATVAAVAPLRRGPLPPIRASCPARRRVSSLRAHRSSAGRTRVGCSGGCRGSHLSTRLGEGGGEGAGVRGQAISTSMSTGTPLVMTSKTAERWRDCSTIARSTSSGASPLMTKRTLTCW